MNCFNHENVPAVGVCHACGKGLCRDCASENAKGLVCADPCAASREPDPAVGLLQRLSAKMWFEATEALHNTALYCGLLGMLTAILVPVACMISAESTTDVSPFLVTGSALFLALTAVVFVAAARLQYSLAQCLRNAASALTADDTDEDASEQDATDSSEDD